MAIVTDVFNQNALGVIEFQEDVVERIDYKPQLLGSLNLFTPVYSRSRTIAIADRNRSLTLIPTSPNGSPPEELIPKGSRVRTYETVRLAKGSTIYAIELAGVAALPFELQTKEITEEVTDRTAQIMDDLELTWEYMRFGAVQGKVLDADGSVIVDWYDFWGIAEPDEINFELDKPGTDVRAKIRQLKRAMQKAAKGIWTPATKVGALVGDTFFDMLVNHPSVKETKLNTEKAATLENIEAYSAIEIEGVARTMARLSPSDRRRPASSRSTPAALSAWVTARPANSSPISTRRAANFTASCWRTRAGATNGIGWKSIPIPFSSARDRKCCCAERRSDVDAHRDRSRVLWRQVPEIRRLL